MYKTNFESLLFFLDGMMTEEGGVIEIEIVEEEEEGGTGETGEIGTEIARRLTSAPSIMTSLTARSESPRPRRLSPTSSPTSRASPEPRPRSSLPKTQMASLSPGQIEV